MAGFQDIAREYEQALQDATATWQKAIAAATIRLQQRLAGIDPDAPPEAKQEVATNDATETENKATNSPPIPTVWDS